MRALAKERADRFDSVASFRQGAERRRGRDGGWLGPTCDRRDDRSD